jgi:hypothetical protein
MHYAPLSIPARFPMGAVYQNTAPTPTSPWVLPGNYTAKLNVGNNTQSQSFTIMMDPRIKTPAQDLKTQHDLSLACYEAQKTIDKEIEKREDLKTKARFTKEGLDAYNAKIIELKKLKPSFESLLEILQEADVKPTTQASKAVKEHLDKLKALLKN